MELAILLGFFALLGAVPVLWRNRRRRPPKAKPPKQDKPRKIATPPTARVAEIMPAPATPSMDENLRRFVYDGWQAIEKEIRK